MTEDFAALLAPLDVVEFARTTFERAPVYIPGDPARVAAWAMEPEAVFELVAARRADASVKGQYFDDAGHHRVEAIDPTDAAARYAAGWTICVHGIHTIHPGIAELARSARAQLGCAGDVFVNAYVSPAGQGFGLHFDSYSVFNIQLVGEKQWRHSRAPAVAVPPYGCSADDAEPFRQAFPWADFEIPSIDALETAAMSPGDVLYLPAGTWHRARAGERSVALSLSPVPLTVCNVVIPLLSALLLEDPAWRAYLPLTPGAPPRMGAPAAIEAVWSERARELQGRFATLVPRLNVAWRRAMAASARPAIPTTTRDLTPDDTLHVSQPASLLQVGNTIVLFAGTASVELPADKLPFVRRLVETTRFVAGDATCFCDGNEALPWEDVRATLATLLAAGVLG